MRRLFLALSLLVLLGMQLKQPSFFLLVTGSALLLRTERKGKVFVLVLLFILLVRLNLPTSQKTFREGYITEINASSLIVSNGLDRVLVLVDDPSIYHAFDRIVIDASFEKIESRISDFGFDAQSWAFANQIQGVVREVDIVRFCKDSPIHFLLSGGVAQHDAAFVLAWRELIYDTGQDNTITGFISLGLQFSLILTLLHRLTQRIPSKVVGESVIFVCLLLFSSLFGFPLTSLRFILFFITSRIFTDRKLSFSFNIFVFFLYQPNTLTQWTLLIPLIYQFTSVLVKKPRQVYARTFMIGLVFLRSNAILYPLSLIFFPLLRLLYMVVSVLFWLSLFIPYLSYFSTFTYHVFNVLVSSLPLESFSLTGTIPDFFIYLSVFVFMALCFHRRLRYLPLLFILVAPYRYYLNPFPQVVFFNAGQGDAMLIRSSFAKCTVLLDTGPPYEAQNLLGTIRSKSVDHVDAMIVTHSDMDHSGNLEEFDKAFEIDEVVQENKDVECPGLFLKNLDPGIGFNDENADSLVYATSLSGVSFLFMADADVRTEEEILKRYALTTDILKLGHHGSKTSSSQKFIGDVRAKIAIISVGQNNYGHPSPLILQRLDAFRLDYLTTRSEGDITFTLVGGYALVTTSKNTVQILKFGE